jgi:hypothetical protein
LFCRISLASSVKGPDDCPANINGKDRAIDETDMSLLRIFIAIFSLKFHYFMKIFWGISVAIKRKGSAETPPFKLTFNQAI